MNILLAYPKFPKNTYWSFSYALPFVGKKASMPPLGLITIASMLPNEWNIKLIDLNIESLEDDDILWADMVFTSSMIVQKESLNYICKRCKKLNVKVVAGGPYPTQYYHEIENVDHFILGEAETGVVKAFIEDIKSTNQKYAYARAFIRPLKEEKLIDEKEYKKLVDYFPENSDISLSEKRPSMDLSPIPRFELLKINKYGSMAVQLSRGCPFHCDFCNEGTLFGHKVRLKPAQNLIKEFKLIFELGYKGALFIVDDNFIGNIKKIKEALPEIIHFQKKHGYPFNFYTEASINLAKDDELLKLMSDAGFNMVFIGIETPCKEALISMGKHQNINTNLVDDVHKIQKFGMEVTAGFIVGNDHDPLDTCDRIFEFCQKTGIPTVMVGLLTAVKGSELYNRLLKADRLLEDTMGNNTHNFEFNFLPLEGIDHKIIISNYKTLLSNLYDKTAKNYFARCKILLNNMPNISNSSRQIRYNEILAFIKSIIIQTFTIQMFNYWKFLIYVIIKKIKHLPEAVRFGIYGHHFIKITHIAFKADFLEQTYIEKMDCLFDKVKYNWNLSLKKKERFLNKITKEKKKFLSKFRKKINKLDPDYQPSLIETCNNVNMSFDMYLTLNEKMLNLKKSIIDAYSSHLITKEEWLKNFKKDNEEYFNKIKVNIEMLQTEYRTKLLDTWKNINFTMDINFNVFEKLSQYNDKLQMSYKLNSEKREEMINNLRNEIDLFLSQIRESIESIPKEYRNNIIISYESITNIFNDLKSGNLLNYQDINFFRHNN